METAILSGLSLGPRCLEKSTLILQMVNSGKVICDILEESRGKPECTSTPKANLKTVFHEHTDFKKHDRPIRRELSTSFSNQNLFPVYLSTKVEDYSKNNVVIALVTQS